MGLFDDEIVDPVAARRRATLDLPGFSKKQIQREYYLFHYNAFRGRKPLNKILIRILRGFFYVHPWLSVFYRRFEYHWALIKRRVKSLLNSKE
jgi:hypothetical protein